MHCSNSAPKSYYTFKKNCTLCQKEAQNLLSTADGEYIIYADRGRVTNLKKNNEYEHSSELSKKSTQNGQRLLKGYELEDLVDLAKTNKLKKLEFTKTRRMRMTFSEEKKDGPPQNLSNKKAQQRPNKNSNPNHIGHCSCKNGSNANASPTYVGHGPCPNGPNNASKEDGSSINSWYSSLSNRSYSNSCTNDINSALQNGPKAIIGYRGDDDTCSTSSLQWTCPTIQGEGTSNVVYNHHNYLNGPYGYGSHYSPHMGAWIEPQPQSPSLPPPQPTPTCLEYDSRCIIM
ncbi:hypothetical protein PIB30_012433 [Stylosanthes scabra]|uniref:Uncharacterized protein n=1 Tax=Stylosanthes scabra TaxID=79078 RepID=A0ABU6S6A3_9FABA|nr:hypothetical protein [Stylosanthes scabra]